MAAALTAAIAALAHLVYETDCDGYTSYKVAERRRPGPRTVAGELAIKGVMAAQYFGLFGYMVYEYLQTACAPHTVVWFCYLPGILLYALQWPADGPRFGAHDIFHGCVMLGHVASMVCDAINVSWDCAAIDVTEQ